MGYISVDVDLSDLDLNEILCELEERYNSCWNKEKNQKEINDFIKEMNIDFSHQKTTLLDKMKIEFLNNNLDKIKLSDLENLI